MNSKNKNYIYIALLMVLSILMIVLFGLFAPSSGTDKANNKQENQHGINGREEVEFAEDSYHLEDNSTLYDKKTNRQVQTMYLTVARGTNSENTNHSWAEINGNSSYFYEERKIDRYKIAGLLQVGDEKGPQVGQLGYGERVPNATVQVRGQTSSKNRQKNYKIEIKKNKGTWNQQTTINLNKHQTDGLRFRNKLAFSLIEDIPQIMGLRTQFVHLYVKDTTGNQPNQFVDYGLYTQVEQLNKDGMRAHGLDSTGHLYKVNSFEFMDPDHVIRLETDKEFDKREFEKVLEIKGSHDHQKMIDLIKTVNDNSKDFEKVLDEYFDIENLSYWMAFQILTGNTDTQSRNMYLYSPLNSKRWYILPWDLDASLYKTEYRIEGRQGYAAWETGISNYWGNQLFKRALKTEKYRKALDAAIKDLKENYLTQDKIRNLSIELSKTVSPYVSKNPDLTYLGFTPEQYKEVLAALPKEVDENYRSYQESMTKPMPFFISKPEVKNGKLKLSWEGTYDFGLKNITYTVEVARDYNFAKPLFKAENVKITSAEMPMPKGTGQYFVRVKAKNEDGKIQDAFDYYVIDTGKVSGVQSFYIQPGNKIVEDHYEEK